MPSLKSEASPPLLRLGVRSYASDRDHYTVLDDPIGRELRQTLLQQADSRIAGGCGRAWDKRSVAHHILSTFSCGDSGYPVGGSTRTAGNMAETFKSMGGEILYRTAALGIEKEADGWAVRTAGGLGLKTSLSEWPRSMQVVLKTPVQAAGITYDTLVVNKLFQRG